MSKKKQKAVLIVPPGGKGIATIRIPQSMLIVFAVLLCCGFAGYFIPFNSFSVDVVETNKKNNLDEQNKRLISAIRPMRRFLENLDNEIEKLDQKKQKISRMLGIVPTGVSPVNQSKSAQASQLNLDNLLPVVSKEYALFASIAQLGAHPSEGYFDVIPVIKPVIDSFFVGMRFGKNKDPFTDFSKMHYGMDFFVSRGSPVIATASGVVVKVEDSRMWGKRITINHAHGFSTVYAHLGAVAAFAGKKVKKGDPIASAGLSGLSTGVHIHYEIWHNGKAENPEDYFFPQFAAALP
ncbi:MAG TPA: M23 family metallopeptidase [Chitinivibrionales bacterium]